MNRGYDWRLGKVRSIATDGKVIYDTALSKFRLSDAFEHTYDPLLNTLGTLLNPIEYPDNAVVTKSGKYITSVNGKFILTVNGFVPLNALRTLTGNPGVTKSGKYITI